ncbi:UTP--glucose-1-phosphate uridylyltransferase [Candidatus Protochlamydia phocaeensis]|uniref:UTP--glucose-1-phosphate uridylyltransferase n=1 Tax=Candidatus Protochlamydia phocaeensis TaxID=1414722 RepID=UPI0008383E32|nr:UTP--glucose-1-phosphate uridylyltransferase [Candidatus Protochlamydia phocaeensis]
MCSSKTSLTLEQQIQELTLLTSSLQKASNTLEKLSILNSLPVVQEFLHSPSPLKTFLAGLNPECDYVIKSIIAIGQGPIVFNMHHTKDDWPDRLRNLLEQLLNLEDFYRYMGGIIGYHLTVLTFIVNQNNSSGAALDHAQYIHPEGLYLGQDNREVRQSIDWGIESLDQLGEIYPVGGAGDRLNLIDEYTGVPLPAAVLPFLGRTLLEGLIRDLQAREYLYFKLYGKQLQTPIAMMTSIEKNNHNHILAICRQNRWFGRSPQSFYFFIQPLVPVITQEGNWSLSSSLTLTRKPGGHGVLWKLAEEQGVFDWLLAQKRQHCLVRQINNPLAGTDCSLLGLIGIGCKMDKALGFVSCERLLNSAEGTNVVIETQTSEGFEYRLTNIEYTDFAQKGIGEEPAKPGSPFSIYPTNTNILFVHIPSIREALKDCPIPGQLINMKSKVSYIDPEGKASAVLGGRLESTMQNIADYLVDRFKHPLKRENFRKNLRTFIVYNQRVKTISTTKKSYNPGESPVSTPEQAYYDMLSNNRNLLEQNCQFDMPPNANVEEYLKKGPACIFLFHPALGPLYAIIAQKIRKGRFAPGAELQLEIAEVDISSLDLTGSLLIEAAEPLGTKGQDGLLSYGRESRCMLHRVVVRNKGVDYQAEHTFWKNQIKRQECVKIILHEGAEFFADQVTLEGNCLFEVPAFHRLTLSANQQGEWVEELVKIERPTWQWEYKIEKENFIKLSKKESPLSTS